MGTTTSSSGSANNIASAARLQRPFDSALLEAVAPIRAVDGGSFCAQISSISAHFFAAIASRPSQNFLVSSSTSSFALLAASSGIAFFLSATAASIALLPSRRSLRTATFDS